MYPREAHARDWTALVVNIHPHSCPPGALRQGLLPVPGRHEDRDAAWNALQEHDLATRHQADAMRKVMNGCKVCGKRMLTDGSPLIYRTCDDCKLEPAPRGHDRKTRPPRRKAERHVCQG